MIAICLAILLFSQASEQQQVPTPYFDPTVDLYTTCNQCNQYCSGRSKKPITATFAVDVGIKNHLKAANAAPPENPSVDMNEPIPENPSLNIANLQYVVDSLENHLNGILPTIEEKLRDINRLNLKNTQT